MSAIKKSEIIESGILDEIIEDGLKYTKVLEEQNKQLKESARLHKEQAKQISLSVKGVKDLENLEKQSISTEEKATQNKRDQLRIEQELEKARKLKIQRVQAEIRLGQQQQKIKEKNNKNLKTEEGAYKRLSTTLNETRKRYKDLLAEGRGLEKGTIDLGKKVELLDKKLKGIDASAGQFQRSVGNYSSALNGLGNGFKSIIRLAGQFGLAMGGVAILRGAFNVVKDFDQATANLSAILGKTKDQIPGLISQAKELGATTSYTASEVAGLQTELAKLGFTVTEIEQSTATILDFSKATGADLSSAAALAGSALRAFGLDASEMGRVTSVLGVSTTKTALDFSKLENGLSTVAPVANAFGFSIEETTALLGQLANAGFDASSAATATRNILLNLADSNGQLAKELGRPITSAKDLAEGLNELTAKGIDLSGALELTDVRSVAAFETFLKNADSLGPLVESLTDVEDGLKAIAETQDNTLTGSIARLTSAWEGYILKINEASGVGYGLREGIEFLAKNLDTILDVLLRVGRAFLTFRTVLFLTNRVVIPLSKGIKTMSSGLVSNGKSVSGAAKAWKGFNSVLKANLIAFITIAVIELVDALDLFTSKAEKAAQKLQEIKDKEAERRAGELEGANKAVEAISKGSAERLKAIQKEIDLIELSNKSEAEKQRLIEGQLKLKKDILNAELEQLEAGEIQAKRNLSKRGGTGKSSRSIAAEIVALEKEYKQLDAIFIQKKTGWDYNRMDSIQRTIKELTVLQEATITAEEKIAVFAQRREQINNEIWESEKEIISGKKEAQNSTKLADEKSYDSQKEKLKILIKQADTEEKKIDLEKQLADLETDSTFQSLLKDEAFRNQKDKINEIYELTKKLNEFEKDAKIKEIQKEKLENLEDEKKKLNEIIEANIKLDEMANTIEAERVISQKENEIKNDLLTAKTEADIIRINNKEEELTQLRINRENLILKEKIRVAQKEFEIDEAVISSKIKLLEQKENLTETEEKTLKVLKSQLEEITQTKNSTILIAEKENQKAIEEILNDGKTKQLENTKTLNEKLIDSYKELGKAIAEVFEGITEVIAGQLDKQLERLNEQIEASKEKQSQLREIAINGRGEVAEDAKKSLAAEEAAQAQAEQKKIQAEKRKQQLEQTSIILNNIGNLVQQGDSIAGATGKSIAGFQIVKELIKNLGSFYEGTDDTGRVDKPLDSKGGRLAVLHDNEQVWSKKDRAKVGNKKRSEIIEAANLGWELSAGGSMVQNANLMGAKIIEKPVKNHLEINTLEAKLNEVKEAIKEINIPSFQMGEITKNIFEVIEKPTKGKTISYRLPKPKN